MRIVVYSTLGAVFAATACIALAGPLPPPAGYQVVRNPITDSLKAAGKADEVEAVKPNDNWPNRIGDSNIQLRYGWRTGPEDPATTLGRTKDEPAGKRTYLGGLLSWRKITTQTVGCAQSTIVTYNGSWVGAVSGNLVNVSAFHVLGSPAAGQALIDDYAEKMKSVVAGTK
jgi:hypothetical protein